MKQELINFISVISNINDNTNYFNDIIDTETKNIVSIVYSGKSDYRSDIINIIKNNDDYYYNGLLSLSSLIIIYTNTHINNQELLDMGLNHYLPASNDYIINIYDRFILRRSKDYIGAITKGDTTDNIFDNIKMVNRLHKNWIKSINTTLGSALYHHTLMYDEWIFKSILDSNTTLFCKDHNNNRYKQNQGPLPPCHINCKSIAIPVGKNNNHINTYEQFVKSLSSNEFDDLLGRKFK